MIERSTLTWFQVWFFLVYMNWIRNWLIMGKFFRPISEKISVELFCTHFLKTQSKNSEIYINFFVLRLWLMKLSIRTTIKLKLFLNSCWSKQGTISTAIKLDIRMSSFWQNSISVGKVEKNSYKVRNILSRKLLLKKNYQNSVSK